MFQELNLVTKKCGIKMISDMTLDQANQVGKLITDALDPDANIMLIMIRHPVQ